MNRSYYLEQATEEDGPHLLSIIEETTSGGNIELIYTRRGNPYNSFRKEGGQVSVGVIRNKDGRADFMEYCVLRPYYLNGTVQTVGYLGGVRKRNGAHIRGNWLRMLIEYEGAKCPSYFLSILDSRPEALQMFTKKRTYMFPLTHICHYTTYMINPSAIIAHTDKAYRAQGSKLRTAAVAPSQLAAVYEFLADYGRRYQFFPAVTDLKAQFNGLRSEDCFVLYDTDHPEQILAFGALWDQSGYRQYIVKRYRGIMRLAHLASPIAERIGYIPIPPCNQTFSLSTLSLLSARDANPEYLAILIRRLSIEAKDRGIGILVAGVADDNWQRGLIHPVKSISFGSNIFLAQKHPVKSQIPKGLPIHIECGLL